MSTIAYPNIGLKFVSKVDILYPHSFHEDFKILKTILQDDPNPHNHETISQIEKIYHKVLVVELCYKSRMTNYKYLFVPFSNEKNSQNMNAYFQKQPRSYLSMMITINCLKWLAKGGHNQKVWVMFHDQI